MPDWVYDAETYTYTSPDGETLTEEQVIALRDVFIATYIALGLTLSSDLASGTINIQQWVLAFREELKTVYINEYLLGRGGIDAMTQADWGSIGGMLNRQYQFMDKFAKDIISGKLSPAQVDARMKLYFNSATQAYERAKRRALGMPELPQYPGDGRTRCMSNCKCNWHINEDEEAWYCYWMLNPAEHCPDCINNSLQWNPLVFSKV